MHDLLYVGGLGLGAPLLAAMSLRGGRLPTDRPAERLGRPSVRPRDGRPRLWIHAVSVGEVNLAATFARHFLRAHPGWEIVVSTNTSTGRAQAERAFPDASVFYFPLDLSVCVEAAWRRVRPDLVVLVELEVWPNFLERATATGTPVVVINGRITERTARRYRMARGLLAGAFRSLALVCAQSEDHARRFRGVGVRPERLLVSGNIKYDLPPRSDDGRTRAERFAAIAARDGLAPPAGDGPRPVLVAGSTHAPEEKLIAGIARRLRDGPLPGLQLIVAPRHVERGAEVAEACRAAGLRPVRRSRAAADGPAAEPGDALVLDVIGELVSAYEAADVVFVGGSFCDRGGQNVIEPAGLERPVVVGPNTRNFTESVGLLRDGGGLLQVQTEAALADALRGLLTDPGRAAEMGRRAGAALEDHRGATERTVASMAGLLRGAAAA